MKITRTIAIYAGASGVALSLSIICNPSAYGQQLAKWDAGVSKKFEVKECIKDPTGITKAKKCGGVNFGTFGVNTSGDVNLNIKPNTATTSVEATNAIRVTMFGGTMKATIGCTVTATGDSQICFDAITRQIKASNGTGAECKLTGVPQSNIKMEAGIELSVCTDLSINLSNPKKPTGTIGASVSAKVSFPSIKIAGQKIGFPDQKWNQKIFSMPLK